jgi:hypothetical protein
MGITIADTAGDAAAVMRNFDFFGAPLAVGYSDPDFPANKLHIGRDPVAEHVVFLDN